jgi:hypothetical protein
MRVIRASQHVVVPWKNGGGTATDIVASPEGAGFEGFDWRLSGARVAKPGPFSVFPDVDRTMFILSGGRLELAGLPGGPATLTSDSPPYDFPGDIPVTAEVPEGPIDNLNLMIDRRRFARAARRMTLAGPAAIEPRGVVLVYCERGVLQAGGIRLDEKDTLVAEGRVTLGGVGSAIVMEIWPL